MDFPVVSSSPLERGREYLASLSPVKRPDFLGPKGPTCYNCGATLTDDITEKMDVLGLEYCPVCVLSDVYPGAVPRELEDISSKNELSSMIKDTFGSPPRQVTTENRPRPGVYILWCPPLTEEQLNGKYGRIKKLASDSFTKILSAANKNGLLYVGKGKNDVADRIWKHSRAGGPSLTAICNPDRLVAIDWLNPKDNLRDFEKQVGQWVAESVEESGYEIEVYWR